VQKHKEPYLYNTSSNTNFHGAKHCQRFETTASLAKYIM